MKIKFGSHLYGTNLPNSDLDIKSIFIPSAKDIILQRIPKTINETKTTESGTSVDIERFALHQYLKLLSDGQTIAVDMLFAPNSAQILMPHYYWDYLFENREKILNKKSSAFVGYCVAQANKYGVKGSRIKAVQSIVDVLTEGVSKFGTTAKIERIAEKIPVSKYIIIEKIPSLSQPDGVYHLNVCNTKFPFFATIKLALSVYKKILSDYGIRAYQAESNSGIDWKALYHAVRIGREGLEFLQTHQVTFPRPEAPRLLKIRLGELTYQEVIEEINEILSLIKDAQKTSTLPDSADQEWIDDFIFQVYRKEILRGN